ncbi:MAG: type II secretion system protein GspE [Rhodospirillales bacterium 20-64-7]|nr:MAG: type II secretion system protein GspE [Rhodospirillales bacterium 20-64-7]HQT77044.1 ATPase, T2SS/T4P/T4SS family [Rhodopila sp.]
MNFDPSPTSGRAEVETAGRSQLAAAPSIEALIEHMVAAGTDPRAIERARLVTADNGQRLDTILLSLGLVSERQMAEAGAALLGTTVIRPDQYPATLPDCAAVLASRYLRAARCLPLSDTADGLTIAVADPLDTFAPAAIAAATGRDVRVRIAVPVELEAAMARLLPDPEAEDAEQGGAALEDDAERLKDLASEAPVIRLVNQIIARAVETSASDIHIEPFEDSVRIRYRYDGVLQETDNPPPRLAAAIVSRIKIMARLDIAERRLPQDGRIRLAVRGQDVDFRVSTLASMHGETVVLRVLDRSAVTFAWDKLGLAPAVVGQLEKSLALPNGIVLVTGPTGSGKTTTLYTGLLALNAVTRKIITVEDPIEYQLRGINQVQVKPQIGLTFATLLRTILRQDPDVIMVGEIRDLETAQIAVQAALTGHLVLSTLHTNSAAATITRLRDMGLEDYLMTAVLRGVLAQRLVRRLCRTCRRPAEAPPAVTEQFRLDPPQHGGKVTLWHPVGCADCRKTGYRGRLAIAEFLPQTEQVERLILGRADQNEIERAAVAAGMVPLFRAGVAAALDGTTTIEEVVRGIQADS